MNDNSIIPFGDLKKYIESNMEVLKKEVEK